MVTSIRFFGDWANFGLRRQAERDAAFGEASLCFASKSAVASALRQRSPKTFKCGGLPTRRYVELLENSTRRKIKLD
jgi:hypothetical protein